MNEHNASRIVLRRSSESRLLRGIGTGLFLGLFLLFAWATVTALGDGYWGEFVFYFALTLLFFPRILIYVRDFAQKVVLLDNFISLSRWHGIPKVYAYNQITNVETVEILDGKLSWEPETFVRVTFDDGKSIKVHKGLMRVREFRKLLRAKTGRTVWKTKARKSKVSRGSKT